MQVILKNDVLKQCNSYLLNIYKYVWNSVIFELHIHREPDW